MARYPSSGVSHSFGPGRMTPAVKLLVITNLVVFVMNLIVPMMTLRLGLQPQAVFKDFAIWQPVTYMFLHAPSPSRILFNMLILWMFGVELERVWRFQVAETLQREQNDLNALVGGLAIGVYRDLRSVRWLVRIRYPSEVRDLVPERFPVESFDVPADALVEGTVDVDLHEVADLRTRLIADLAIRGDGGGNGDHAVPSQELGDIRDPQDVFVTVGLAEAETFGQTETDLVAVEDLDLAIAPHQLLLEPARECALA